MKINKSIILTLMIAFNLTVVSNHGIAGGWKDLKNNLKSKKHKKAAQEITKQALQHQHASNGTGNHHSNHHASSSPGSSGKGSSKHGSQPNPELRSSVLKCDDVKLTNVQIGNSSSYQVTEGLSKSSYTGFINRRPAEVSHQCFVGVLDRGECVTMEVPQSDIKRVTQGDHNSLKMQCVYSNDPGEMATAEVPYTAKMISLNQMLLKCGHDQGDDYACDEGSNSQRAGKYKKQLKDKQQLSVCATTYHQVKNGGQHIYCQYYNKKSKKSLFAFEFLQSKN